MKKMSVKKWYKRAYPDDEMASMLDDNVTFSDLMFTLIDGGDFYEKIGDCDSVIRERVFNKLSLIYKVDYDFIYNLWLKR